MPEIPRTPVKSSNIKSVGHCAKTNTLAVEFASGGVYHYPDVSAEEHAELLGAKSIGSHHFKTFRRRPCTKVS